MKGASTLLALLLATYLVSAQYAVPPTKGKKHRTTTTTTEPPGGIDNEITGPIPIPGHTPDSGSYAFSSSSASSSNLPGSSVVTGSGYWWQGSDRPFSPGSQPGTGCDGNGCGSPSGSPSGCGGSSGGCGPIPPPPPPPVGGGCGGPAGCTGVGTDPRPSPAEHPGKPVDIAQNPFLSSAILGKPISGSSGQYPSQGSSPTPFPGQPANQYPGQPTGQPSGQYPSQSSSSYPGQHSGSPSTNFPGQPSGQPIGSYPAHPTGQHVGTSPSQTSGKPFGSYPGQPSGQPTNNFPGQHSGVPSSSFPGQHSGQPSSTYPGQQSGSSPYPGQVTGPTQVPGSPGQPNVPLRPQCSVVGHACVPSSMCVGGVITPNGMRQMRDPQIKECIPGLEACCRLPPGAGSPPFSNSVTPTPGYGSGVTQRPYSGPLNTTPYPGCPAALKCVSESYCTVEGVMSNTPVFLTREQTENKVPLTDCQDPDTGIIGKCCRDPNYKDPWPAGMMMKNPGDYDDGQYHGEGSGPVVSVGPSYNTISSTPHTPGKDHGPKPSDRPGGFKPFPPPFPGNTPTSQSYTPGGPQPGHTFGPTGSSYQPGQPTHSGTPYQPGKPSPTGTYQPGQPSGTPYQPGPTGTPYQPGQPSPTGTSYQPGQPGPTGTSYQPGQSGPTGTPFQPGQPSPTGTSHQPGHSGPTGTPYQPGQPSPTGASHQPGHSGPTGTPYQPGQPSPTGTSYQPGHSGSTGTPYQPSPTGTSYQPGQSGPTGTPYQPGQQGPTGTPYQPGQPGPTGTSYQPGQTGPTGTPYQPGQPGLPGTSYQPGQSVPSYQPGQPQPGFPDQQSGFPDQQPEFPGQNPDYTLPTHPGQNQPSGLGPQTQGPAPGSSCGIRRPGPKGDEAGFAEFPWQALVVSAGNRSLLCGAAIIADNAVITAAHCVNQIRANDLLVKAGEWKLLGNNPKPVQVRPVVAIARHPGYNSGTLAKDLAILVLAQPFTLDTHVDKICIPPELGSEYFQKPGQNCVLTGWGKNALQGPIQDSSLHKVDVNVVPAKQCEAELKNSNLGKYFILNEGFSCALPPVPSDICKVDFGSAVACERGDGHYELAGVNSWDIACQTKKPVPTVFATSDAQWISTVISTPIPILQAEEESYNQSLLKGENVDGVDIDDKPGFNQGYGK